MPKLLIVEDDATMRGALAQILTASGYEVEPAADGLSALEKARDQSFDLIISDIRMPGMDGVTAVSRLKENFPKIKTILITGFSDEEPLARALNLGVDGILKKPFALKDLLNLVSVKLEEKRREDLHLHRELKYGQALSRLRSSLGEDKFREISGGVFPLLPDVPPDHIHRLAVLMELGRMAEMRREFNAAVQAYEQGLSMISGSGLKREEFPVRLALAGGLARIGETELGLLHGEEALRLAREMEEPELVVEARHHLGRLLLPLDPGKCREHLAAAAQVLETVPLEKSRAANALLFCALWRGQGDTGRARESALKFISAGKRSFVPEILVFWQETALESFLLALEGDLQSETAAWILEQAAPFIQDRLLAAAKVNPSLAPVLSRWIPGGGKSGRPALEIFAFGRLVMFLDGASLLESHWRSVKGRCVFLYLAHEFPKVVSEDQLLDTFWPSLDAEKGRHAFRTTLYFIRRSLGPRRCAEFILTDKQKFGLRPGSSFACDFLRFRDYYEKARHHWEKGERDHAALFLKEAESLYKGDFLQGWSEDWIFGARENFRDHYTWLLMALAAYHRRQKSWNQVLHYAQKAAGLDPTLEDAHFFSMESFLETGKRDEAVKQYHVCREILKNELNVSPSDNTRRLYFRAIDARPAEVGA